MQLPVFCVPIKGTDNTIKNKKRAPRFMMNTYGINQLLIKALYIKKYKESRIFDYSKQKYGRRIKRN